MGAENIKTGDGRPAADPSEFHNNESIAADLDEMTGDAPSQEDNSADQQAVARVKNTPPSAKKLTPVVKKKQEVVEETEEEEEENVEPAEGETEEENQEEGEEVGEDEGDEGSPDIPESLKKYVEGMQKQIKDMEIAIKTKEALDKLSQPKQQQTNQQQPQEKIIPGAVTKLNKLTAEQHADIMSDPDKFVEFVEQSLARNNTQFAVNLAPMINQTISIKDAVKEFFGRPENIIFSKGPARLLVEAYADQVNLQEPELSLAGCLQKGADLARVELGLQDGKGGRKPVLIGRKGLQAAQAPTPVAGGRFAQGTGRRVAPAQQPAKSLKNAIADELDEMATFS